MDTSNLFRPCDSDDLNLSQVLPGDRRPMAVELTNLIHQRVHISDDEPVHSGVCHHGEPPEPSRLAAKVSQLRPQAARIAEIQHGVTERKHHTFVKFVIISFHNTIGIPLLRMIKIWRNSQPFS